jgi:hypothetical protein
MNTDRLIDMLSTNLEPVKGGQLGKTLAWAIVIGLVAAFGVMLACFGIRSDLVAGNHSGALALKIVFALSLVGTGAAFLIKSMVPGRQEGHRFALIFLPFFAASGAVIEIVVRRPALASGGMIEGAAALLCLFCIPFLAIIPFALLIWALRKGAPTDLRRSGAVAGLVAGAIGAIVYSFSCPSDSWLFVFLGYTAAVALCSIVGAQVGPRLLRW